ncbi:MAG: hypothetical protein R3E64_04015 [Halioglobus sp.]
MKVNDIFINGNTFTATVAINIPGKDADRAYSPTVEYRYLDQDQLDALLSGESIEIDGQTVESGDDASLDKVWWAGKAGRSTARKSSTTQKTTTRH